MPLVLKRSLEDTNVHKESPKTKVNEEQDLKRTQKAQCGSTQVSPLTSISKLTIWAVNKFLMEIISPYSQRLFLPSTFVIILTALCCWSKVLMVVGLQGWLPWETARISFSRVQQSQSQLAPWPGPSPSVTLVSPLGQHAKKRGKNPIQLLLKSQKYSPVKENNQGTSSVREAHPPGLHAFGGKPKLIHNCWEKPLEKLLLQWCWV